MGFFISSFHIILCNDADTHLFHQVPHAYLPDHQLYMYHHTTDDIDKVPARLHKGARGTSRCLQIQLAQRRHRLFDFGKT